ncbi:Rv3235 family protein [Nocardia sp. NBC_00881]|uniref:Rv3235 family protein n=1 Tax=Nocardia sp. NBC_00881 TaxID=2975995 RepID=UPI003870D11A|nr:Rv3235 family protein [Nocardia sp. NBC_00881]
MAGYRDWLSPAPNPEPPLESRRGAEVERVARNPVARESPCRTRAPAADSGRVGAGVRHAMRKGHGDTSGDHENHLAARHFAEAAVRVALEVLDRRRSVSQLAGVADPTVIAAVRTLIGADLVPGRSLGVAVPTRVSVTLVDAKTAEVCAGYARGGRHFALAARITRTRSAGWRLTALRIR